MKEKLQFSDFVQALVDADTKIKEAAGLDAVIASLTKQKQHMVDDLRKVSEDVAAAKAGAEKYRENLNKESASMKAAVDAEFLRYRKAKDDETKAAEARTANALAEAHVTLARAQSDAAAATTAATQAKAELEAIQTDLAEARAMAQKLSKFAGVGKA